MRNTTQSTRRRASLPSSLEVHAGRLFRVSLDQVVAGVFSVAFDDRAIWGTLESGEHLYLHRITRSVKSGVWELIRACHRTITGMHSRCSNGPAVDCRDPSCRVMVIMTPFDARMA
jgi:hypothetical protein